MAVSLKQLRAFVTVASSGSFTAASDRLNLTQSAVSLLIKELERELGARLFDRGTRRTELTSVGAGFYPLAARVIDDLENALESARHLSDQKRGTVRVACTLLYAAALLPKFLAHYKQLHPAVRVHVVDCLTTDVLARVISGEVDFGIAPQRSAPAELHQELLFRDRMDVVCLATHELARSSRTSWKQVMQHPFVSLTADFTARLQADLLAWSKQLELRPIHEVSYLTTALGLVKWGQGITALPSSYAAPLIAPFGLVAVTVDHPVVQREISLFARRGHSLSPTAESFRVFLQQAEPSGPRRDRK